MISGPLGKLLGGVLALAIIAAAITIVLLGQHHKDAGKPITGATLGGSKPGSLISATTLPHLVTARKDAPIAARVVYRSTNGDTHESTVVSGTVFVPKGTAPAGGWPVVAVGHSTVGINNSCAPSLSDSLAGNVKLVLTFTTRGFAVAMTDYQGLGEPGIHPYLDARTEGYNMIDSVRALRATFPDVSTTWGAYGGSQGGGAAWSADEQAASYAPDLKLVGAAVVSPAADVTAIVDKAVGGTLTADQRPAFVYVVETLARLNPIVDRNDYRRGAAKDDWSTLISCAIDAKSLSARGAAAKALTALDLVPVTQEAADKARFLLRRWSLPQHKLSAPLAVAYGGKDTFIDSSWTDGSLLRACALGGTLVRQFFPDKGHGNVDPGPAISWLTERFKGTPVTNECPAG